MIFKFSVYVHAVVDFWVRFLFASVGEMPTRDRQGWTNFALTLLAIIAHTQPTMAELEKCRVHFSNNVRKALMRQLCFLQSN